MSSFEWNKIIASVLTAMIVAWVCGILASQLVEPRRLEKPVFMPEGASQAAAAAAEQPTATKLEPIDPLLAKADPKRGEQLTKICATSIGISHLLVTARAALRPPRILRSEERRVGKECS